MTKNILSTPERKTIKLGDKEYRLSSFNLNVMADIEEEFNCSIDLVGKELNKRRMSAMRKLLYILLKHEYPELTLSKIGEIIDVDNLAEVSEALAKTLAGE